MTARTALPTNPFRAPERALAAKTRLDEFEIERVLAQSSFAVVYRAYDHALKLHVAIKEYLPDALALRSAETQVVLRARTHTERFELGLQAFIDEAQTLARCDHPALLRIARILQRHGTAYRVMRYSPGPTLLAHRRELAATPAAQALRGWLDALLGALDALHEEGCVHAAVAPGNILLLPGGRPMLLDFDAVPTALISDRTQSMMAALEPCFEPIEQRAPTGDVAMGPWTDLYALAATLHFCIGGQLPAPPSGAPAAQPFEPLGTVWQRLCSAQPELGEAPPWLNALDACLHEAPGQRPQSVAQLRGLLDPSPRAPAGARPAPPRGGRVSGHGPDILPGVDLDSLAPWTASLAASLPASLFASAPAGATAGETASASPSASATQHAADAAAMHAARSASALAAYTARPGAPPAAWPIPPPVARPIPQAGAAAAPPFADPPARPPTAMAAADAKVMADLDKTFAFIAAQANEDATPAAVAAAAAAAAAAGTAAAADATTAAADGPTLQGPAAAKPLTRQQLWMAAAAAVAMLLVLAATVAWLLKESQPGLVGGGGVDNMQSLVAPVLAPAKAGGGTSSAGTSSAGTSNAAGDHPPSAAGPSSRNGGAAAAAAPSDVRTAATKPRPPPTSPREACGERTRFALYQCMQTQCTKPAWAKHAQCVRLRKEQKLG